jgi:ubiquinol-cytochrome c reductase cytochrome c1 subunit
MLTNTNTLIMQAVNLHQHMKSLAKLIVICAFFGTAVQANEGTFEKANNDVSNKASLQRGARNFVNYCSGCHSAKYVRFNRLAVDLDLTDDQVTQNLIFNGGKITDTMVNNMSEADAVAWFGKAPPDLSLIARARSTDYLYAFLKSFYLDPSRPTGMNNMVLAGAAMPNVLWELQGVQKAVYEGEGGADGKSVEKHFKGFELVTKGKLSPEEYDEFVRDTVNFLDYIGEPKQLERRALGFRVIGFLLLLFLLVYALKQEYWKDVK